QRFPLLGTEPEIVDIRLRGPRRIGTPHSPVGASRRLNRRGSLRGIVRLLLKRFPDVAQQYLDRTPRTETVSVDRDLHLTRWCGLNHCRGSFGQPETDELHRRALICGKAQWITTLDIRKGADRYAIF